MKRKVADYSELIYKEEGIASHAGMLIHLKNIKLVSIQQELSFSVKSRESREGPYLLFLKINKKKYIQM
jgi:hypothetical protein